MFPQLRTKQLTLGVCSVIALLMVSCHGTAPLPDADAPAAATGNVAPPRLPMGAAALPGRLLHAEDFRVPATRADLDQRGRWIAEQQPGGTVSVEHGRLIIEDARGSTIWFNQRLRAPVIISYRATVSSRSRVSDLNCFWMASDPARPSQDEFNPGFGRSGLFAEYDSLRTYYVGYGGNTNSTTRFRRYAGDGTKPLLPEHDLRAPEFLLVPDHTYEIVLIAAFGRAQFIRDGKIIFDHRDPAPLTEGWFGFRTVHSRIEIGDFRVWEGIAPSGSDD